MKLMKQWNNYWFQPAPLVDLAICRIMIVGFQLYWLTLGRKTLAGQGFLNVFHTLSQLPNELYDPLPILHLLIWPLGWTYRPSFEVLEIIYWITVGAGILALIGLKTRPSLFVFAIGNVFMQAFIYAFKEIHHPEALMLIALSILALSPAGRVLSVDDLQDRSSVAMRRLSFEDFNIFKEKSSFARWPLLLVQWLFSLIYFSAVFEKINQSGLDWVNGYTLQYYLMQDGFRWNIELGIWLSQYHTVVWLISWLTVLWQGTFFLILIFPFLAYVYIPLGIGFHTTIYLTLGAPFFHWLALYAVFIPWARLIKGPLGRLTFLHSSKGAEILYDGQCPLCIRTMTQLRYLDWFDNLRFTDVISRWPSLAEKHPDLSLENCLREMYLLLPDGSVRKGFFTFREILWHLPPLWPLLIVFYLPLASTLGPKIYRRIASRRFRFEKCTSENCLIHSEGKEPHGY
jgi:predicted DCC family thiol-disulfide oxidoreductase YuxK/uncharacterized membrane protein YphA (DoxX/SURF4 family)